jgi:hypothetical protein
MAKFIFDHLPEGNEVSSIEPYAVHVPGVGNAANPLFGYSMDVAFGVTVYYGRPSLSSADISPIIKN